MAAIVQILFVSATSYRRIQFRRGQRSPSSTIHTSHATSSTPRLSLSNPYATSPESPVAAFSAAGETLLPSSSIIYLFPHSPSSPAVTISEFKSLNLLKHGEISNQPPLRLIVFDATWKHAKDMVKASEKVLGQAGAVRVCLDTGIDASVSGGSIYDSELLLRKEPLGGCVSTAEEVARCLRVIEPDGEEIERKLISVLKEMVKLQSKYLKPMKPRPKLLKKRFQNQQLVEEDEEEE